MKSCRHTRREAARLTAGALLAAGLWPGARTRAAEAAARAAGAFRFAVINDTHLGTPECEPWLRGAIEGIKKDAPAFLLHCGDIANDGDHASLETAARVLRELGAPFHTTPGNHDHVGRDDRSTYDAIFADRLNYTFAHEGWQFLGLDTSHGQRFDETEIQPATFRWLDETLPRLDAAKPTVAFTHFPLGEGVKYRPLNAEALLGRLLGVNLTAVFSGHWHGYTERTRRDAPLVTGRCCALIRGNHDGTREKGWWICDAREGRIGRRFVEYAG